MSNGDLRNIKRKLVRLKGKLSDSGNDITMSITEIETPEQTLTESEFFTFDCGCHFDPSKTFIDRFTSRVVCQECTVTCTQCGTKVWKEAASKNLFTGNYYCPNHRFVSFLSTIKKILFGGL